jgi:uncharacterized protein
MSDLDLRPQRAEPLGVLTHGSLLDGVEMKLDAGCSVESVATGTFAVVQGETLDFFCLITDARIAAANEGILLNPPPATTPEGALLRRVLHGQSTYATVALKPMLALPNTRLDTGDVPPRPVKTVPAHFSTVYRADAEDVARVFGAEVRTDRPFFEVGRPLDMEAAPVCVDLDRFVERSNAVFGRTGTGKTFITRLLLAGTIARDRASVLVFDAHSEYGWEGTQEVAGGTQGYVPGLKKLFGSRVVIVTVDAAHARRRNVPVDLEATLYADQIEPSDILPLQSTLGLNATAADSAYLLREKYHERWLERLLRAEPGDLEAMAEETGAHPGSLSALRRKLVKFNRFGFFSTEPSKDRRDVLDFIVESITAGKSVVFEFGGVQDLDAYLLVSGVITRRLRDKYEDLSVRFQGTKNSADEPRRLLITIEEAHRFLAPGIAQETPFGKIAREMRKFYVSLLVVDQRPSAIDDEVMSQIGTRFVAALSDEKDIAAVMTGVSGASALRGILATLDTKQQMLLLGHAVPMPIAVRTRAYDQTFFDAVAPRPSAKAVAGMADDFDTGFRSRR